MPSDYVRTRLRVLVVDDAEEHQAAALQQLGNDYDLTIAKNYDEAIYFLCWSEIQFGIVLTDLLLPASKESQGVFGRKFVGQLMPVGMGLAMVAVTKGAQWIGVLTDTNHHHHPASAMLSRIASYGENKLPPFQVNGAKVGYYQSLMTTRSDGTWIKDWAEMLRMLRS